MSPSRAHLTDNQTLDFRCRQYRPVHVARVRTAALAGWHPPSLRTAPARGMKTPKLSYQRPENGEQVNQRKIDVEVQLGAIVARGIQVHVRANQGDKGKARTP